MKRNPLRIQFKEAPKADERETKALLLDPSRFEVKAAEKDDPDVVLRIKAYALAFGNIDSWGDIILPGACDEFLASEKADRMALCYQHDRSVVIGVITNKGVDDYGMWIEADILATDKGKEVALLLRKGAIKEFSIGYRATKYHYEKRDGFDRDVRILEAIEVYEVSPVTIAANDKAVLVSAKNDPAPAPETNETKQTQTPISTMTPEEIKAMRESIEKAASEKAAAEVLAVKNELKAAQEEIEAKQKSIDNLDESIKALKAKSDELNEKLETREAATFFTALKAALEAKRDEVKAMIESKNAKGSIKIPFEIKTADVTTGDITNVAYGVALEQGIHAARPAANVFYDAFPKDIVRATQFDWLEGAFTDAADYVAELAAAADDDVEVVEKSRKFGKIAAHLRVSSEVADFFEEVYNWARNTAQAKIIAKIDTEILSGLGADSGGGTSPNKIYGLKSNSANYTAFSATGAKYKDATVADVILDAQAQALANGYNLDKAFVTWALYAQIRGLKDANGHYLFNEVTGLLNGVQILPTAKLSSGEIIVVESDIVRIKERPVWELEIVRNASLDGWDVYVRKAAQTLVKTNDKKGVIYVASVATAIAAITEASPAAATAAVLTDAHDSTNHAVKTKAVTE
jgi:HK97 family phage prohead protease/HK97 family phage major capsid protein